MKGNYVRKSTAKYQKYSKVYSCNHPLYNKCTLYSWGEFGLAVVQQRYNEHEKISWWGPIDPWLSNDIHAEPKFREYFNTHADLPKDGIYPTVEVRKLMYALDMKPMKKEIWETPFRGGIDV